MEKWEYKSLYKYGTVSDDEFLAELNMFGADGWELITISYHDAEGSPATVFMRRILR